MEILDISRTIEPNMPLYPGSEPPSQEWHLNMEEGDPNNVSGWKLNSHTGTHVDARKHFVPDGWTMEALDLGRSVGPCRVVDLTHVEGHVGRADLEEAGLAGETRVLLKTRNSSHDLMQREEFEEGYVAVSKRLRSTSSRSGSGRSGWTTFPSNLSKTESFIRTTLCSKRTSSSWRASCSRRSSRGIISLRASP